ncbi:MAG TPA: nitrite reductase small subunit NirD [Chromatiales bacterium]|nr:nitrite reductase small subunit NirD [Chromatiales bacterium]
MSEWLEICRLDDIPRLGARVVEHPDGNIAIFRTKDDRVFALDDRCPHKGGPLSQGIVFDHKVACPLHDWVIDLEKGEAVPPDEGCTHRHPVRVENGLVYLSLARASAAA